MPIDPWFPLAIYYADLEDAAEQKESLVSTIVYLEEKAKERRVGKKIAWTGDLHGVGQIQYDPRFAWVTEQIEAHSFLYLKALGFDLNKLDLYIQRAWPVISRPEQSISAHAHHTSHISAVYYVSVPQNDTPESGCFTIHNSTNMNEFAPGIGGEHTDAIEKWNPFNYKSAYYPPKEGRILIFPSKQMHGVGANKTEETRISLSFDLIVTAIDTGDPSLHEFLSPPPKMWKKLERKPSDEKASSKLDPSLK